MIKRIQSWLASQTATKTNRADPHYVAAGHLPGDADEMQRAGAIEHWRTGADGQEWYRVSQPDGLTWFAAIAEKNAEPDDAPEHDDTTEASVQAMRAAFAERAENAK